MHSKYFSGLFIWIFFCFVVCTRISFAQIQITEADYEGTQHFVIHTKSATYWQDKAGRFSRLIDRDGKDWVSFTLATAAPHTFTLRGYGRNNAETKQSAKFAAYVTKWLPVQAGFQEPTSKARLGEMHYSSLIGGTVGAKGKKFSCELIGEKGRVLSLQVALSNDNLRIVKALRFVTMNERGKQTVKTCGNETNTDWQPTFTIPAGRQLVGISGASGWYIDSLRFHFDDGSTTPLYGGNGGDTEFRVLLNKNNGQWKGHLRGFWGLSENAIEALGLIFWPIE